MEFVADIDYLKYRWFFTSSKKLVIGGKNSEQNDQLLSILKSKNKNLMVMHTTAPGSPFSVILSDSVDKKDLTECAIFTASFSKAWKSGKKSSSVHIFWLSDLYKSSGMKSGTWGVSKLFDETKVPLSLVLTVQESRLRAVPESAVKPKDILLKISPGKEDKSQAAKKIEEILLGKFNNSEILSALPAGGIKIST